MNYLDELKDELRELLDGLDEEQQEIVIKWVTKKTLDSWRNGVKKGKAKAQDKGAGNAPKKSGKRFVKKSEDDD